VPRAGAGQSLAEEGNPTLATLTGVLSAVGLRLSVTPARG